MRMRDYNLLECWWPEDLPSPKRSPLTVPENMTR